MSMASGRFGNVLGTGIANPSYDPHYNPNGMFSFPLDIHPQTSCVRGRFRPKKFRRSRPNHPSPWTLEESNEIVNNMVEEIKDKYSGESEIEEQEDEILIGASVKCECCVCYMEIYQQYALIPCGHNEVCKKCIAQLDKCPICRIPIEGEPIKLINLT